MRKAILVLFGGLVAVTIALSPSRSQTAATSDASPQFTSEGKLVRPEGYRRWVYASSGYGMSYSQKADDSMVMFTNVFVNPSSYDYYLAHGNWPDKTIFVLELYGSTSQGSINKHGSYQTGFMGLDVEVKDEKASRTSGPTSVSMPPKRLQVRPRQARMIAGSAMTKTPRSNIRSCSFIPSY
jgi:hypothetical protein